MAGVGGSVVMLPINHYLISSTVEQPAITFSVKIADVTSGDPPALIPEDPPYTENPILAEEGDQIDIWLSDYGYYTLDSFNAVTSADGNYTPVDYNGYGDYCSFTMPDFDVYVWVVPNNY